MCSARHGRGLVRRKAPVGAKGRNWRSTNSAGSSGWNRAAYAEAMLCTISGGHYPAGTYTVLYEGEGKLAFGKNAKITEAKPGAS